MTGVQKRLELKKRMIALTLMMVFVFLAFFGAVAQVAQADKTRQPLILRIGAQDDMKSRNILAVSDVWSSNVLAPIYEGVGQVDPATEEPVPYNLLGIDADESGVFDLDEYGIYRKEPGTDQLVVTGYYDLNGVYFHDGVQATMHDVLFAYHLNALDPLTTSLDVLKDKNNLPGSNYSTSRWLNVWPVADVWHTAIPVGQNDSLTFALRFEQQATYARFTTWTLNAGSVYPRHIWEGTGKVCRSAEDGVCQDWDEDIHPNFRYAYNPDRHNGRPAADPEAFKFSEAESWLMEDNLVIATGPFTFGEWNEGVTVRIDKFEDYKADVLDCKKVNDVCQGDFFKYMHKPTIDGMLFKIYKTAQAAVFALQAGEIDVVSWSVPPEFVQPLIEDPNVDIYQTAEKGFFYMAYNMRKSPFGYPDNDPTKGDDGLYLRKAIAHVIDKKTIVTTLLQNFGVAGDQPVSPASTRWYNASVTRYDFDLDAARQILDDHYTEAGLELGYGPSGFRNLPTINDAEIELLCPQADYDPIRASSCNMIAANARDVGLNIEAKLLAFGEIVERLNNRDFGMYVLGWRIGSDPPDYYYAFYYSGNSRAGQNYPGFQNDTFDSLITDARAELDLDKQTVLIKQCSGLLTDAAPYDVLYFRTNIEPYRSDRFSNWTVSSAGSIFGGSWWSWIGILPPVKKTMRISLEAPSAMKASSDTVDSAVAVKATVRKLDGTPREGATVTIGLAVQIGYLTHEDQEGDRVIGLSDVNGDFIATYHAPIFNATANESVRVTLAASAKYGDEDTGEVRTDIVVYPRDLPFISVLPRWEAGDIVLTKDSLPLSVEVRDQDGNLVDGALVMVTPELGGPTVSPANGTTIGGKIDFIVTAPQKIPDSEAIFSLDVRASGMGLTSDPYTVSLIVYEPTEAGDGFDMTFMLIAAVIVIAIIAIVASLLAVRKKPKRRRRNK
jgi:ABC-type transport system substrate-binding protein